MNGLIAIAAIVAMLLAAGALAGVADRKSFCFRWLLVAAALVIVNDALLTRGYGLVPDFVGGDWNWQGKLSALAATLAIAALPAFGWARCGITFEQAPGSLKPAAAVALLYCALFAVLALAFPSDSPGREEVAFQLTMPGFEEELFYRGVLLFALDRAFRGRLRLLGIDWGWGAVLSCALFGLAHAFSYADGSFSFDPLTMALTALPSFIAVWLRVRTGSLALPVVLHNFGNSIFFLL